MNQQLFPYPGADGNKSSFVRSTTSAEIAQVRDFFCYEQPTLRFKPVEQNPGGAFNARVAAFNATGYTAVAMIYTKAAGGAVVALGTTPVMDWNAEGYFDGTLSLNTEEAIAATSALAGGGSINARFAFILFGGGGAPFTVEQGVRLFHSLPPAGLPAPTPVTDLIFANLLEPCLGDSDTLTWRRVADAMVGDVPLYGAPGILPALTLGFIHAGDLGLGGHVTPVSDSVSVVVGGVAGERYLLRVRCNAAFELKEYWGGTRKPGDDSHVQREGTPAPNNYDKWFIDISSPPRRVYLNRNELARYQTPVDYFFQFEADAGATVALNYDTNDGISSGGQCTLTFESASELPQHADSHGSGGGDALKLDDLAAPDDTTDLDVSTSAHGLAPKLPGDATRYLDGTGAYSVPAGAGGASTPFNHRGSYDAGAFYAVGDVVIFEGQLWYRTDAHGGNTGDTPSEGQFWSLLAAPAVTLPIGLALTGTRSDVLTGAAKETLRIPVALSLVSVMASLTEAASAGLTTVDIHKNGASILSTKLTIDAGAKSSLTAAAAAVISDTVISEGDEITFDVDTAGTGAKGLKVWLVGSA